MFFKKLLIAVVVAATTCSIANPEPEQPVKMESYQQALCACQAGAPFRFFSSGLTAEEVGFFQSLQVIRKEDDKEWRDGEKEYSRFGELEKLELELATFFASLGNNAVAAEKAAQRVVAFVNEVVKTSGQESAWVVLRASEPRPDFKIPRWHTDGNYYKPYGQNVPKCVLTLKGPQTLFYPATLVEEGELLERLRKTQDQFDLKFRAEVASLFDKSKILSPVAAEGAVFNVGLNENGGVHSEPDINQQRLFLALVLGSNQQIVELGRHMNGFNVSYVAGEMSEEADFVVELRPEDLELLNRSDVYWYSKYRMLDIDSFNKFVNAVATGVPAKARFVFSGSEKPSFSMKTAFDGARANLEVYGLDKENRPLAEPFIKMGRMFL